MSFKTWTQCYQQIAADMWVFYSSNLIWNLIFTLLLQSISSTKSWSSGKSYKAPKPPLKAQLKFWCSKDSNKRQCYLWLSFTCLFLAIIIGMIVILSRFLKGSEKYSREEIDENYLYNIRNGQKTSDKWHQKMRHPDENVVFIAGGNSAKIEVFSSSNISCGLPVAPLPSKRIGNAQVFSIITFCAAFQNCFQLFF